ncbi:class I SAM-dependent methyltransferase [Actinomadura barringtoniae]|uniref:Class I SAM-dependent methyltransferase n=1 Tax=Actinomadura barringtoniae TaxID=1427535 RepID=A0A939T2N1_9ACTN|nr:class I SAM-dependent methyltransferase [Actinomadura barringtoniae]MBO2445494.1 class I SAM-dependent methyltransferase [Actinomadura barringtoniae]
MEDVADNATRDREYLLGSAADLSAEQLGLLAALLDRHTTACLEDVGVGLEDVGVGRRCLDLGAGGGSITRWLAERAGTVVAADLDVAHLGEGPGIRVLRHDINDGVPEGGPFDLIHTRLLLLHLARREEILHELAGALAPGGWLVVAEFGGPRQWVLAAPTKADEELFLRVQELAHAEAGRMGVSYTWADEVDGHMGAAGLVNVHSSRLSQTTAGGTIGCLLNRNYILQLGSLLIERTELTAEELARYCDLMLDPRFRALFYDFTITRGQRPGK